MLWIIRNRVETSQLLDRPYVPRGLLSSGRGRPRASPDVPRVVIHWLRMSVLTYLKTMPWHRRLHLDLCAGLFPSWVAAPAHQADPLSQVLPLGPVAPEVSSHGQNWQAQGQVCGLVDGTSHGDLD